MFSMYGAVILSFVLIRITAGYTIEDCKTYGLFLMDCCKDEFPANKPSVPDGMSECNSKDLSSCERDLCQAKKWGFTDDDGKIDKAKLVNSWLRDADDPGLLDEVKSKCVNGDIDIYATAKACDSEKIARCIYMQRLKRCRKWDKGPRCQLFKGFATECLSFFS